MNVQLHHEIGESKNAAQALGTARRPAFGT
jgi:hypothetical protein